VDGKMNGYEIKKKAKTEKFTKLFYEGLSGQRNSSRQPR